MRLIVITYHYLGVDPNPFPAIYPISERSFKKQIEKIGEKFNFVSLKNVVNHIIGNGTLPQNSCILTFDDGLRSQYEIARPILTSKGIPAIYFINTEPLMDNKPSTIHLIHWLRGNIKSADFKREIKNNLRDLGFDIEVLFKTNVDLLQKVKTQYPYDKGEIAQIKYTLNFLIEWSDMEKMIDRIFSDYHGNYGKFCKAYYFTKSMCKELILEGEIGTHFHSHIPHSRFGFDKLSKDLLVSLNYFSDCFGKNVNAVSYPFGIVGSGVNKLKKILDTSGIKLGFVNTKKINYALNDRFFLSRYNTNDVPGGSRPIISFD